MKKTISVIFCLTFLCVFAACTAEDAPSMTAGDTSSAMQSQQESGAVPEDGSSVSQADSSVPSQESTVQGAVYTQQTIDGTEGAVITFLTDGTFEFRPVFYDGSPFLTGTYEIVDGAHILTPLETTAYNIDLAELGSPSFQTDGDKLVYRGASIGETYDGVIFTP